MTHLFRVVVFLLLAAFPSAQGQSNSLEYDQLLAQAYRDGPGEEAVNDPFQVLRSKPALKAELNQAIHGVEKQFGFRIRLMIRPVWMGGTVQELAATLQNVWFPKGDGLVMIVETDNRKLGLGVSMHGSPEDESWLMPTHASATILKRVADRADQDLPLDEYLRSIVLDMVSEHSAYLEKRLERQPPTHKFHENLFLIGALSVTALGALVVTILLRMSHARERHSVRRFPVVDVPERLGAPYGGGTIATRNFSHRQH